MVLDNALEAWKVYPGYGMNQPYFEYNEADGLYYRYQYGGPHNGDEGVFPRFSVISSFSVL